MKSFRFFLYLRKSSGSEDKQELSIPAQKRELLALLERKRLTLVGEPFEEAASAMAPGRPVFKTMMDALDKGKADGIVCWKVDRLARNPLDGGRIMWALSEGKIKEIVTPDFVYTGTGADKMLMAILFGMATKYSDDLSDNVRRGQREALQRGLWPNRPKLGYTRDRANNRMVPDPVLFQVVREMWRMLLSGTPVLDVLHFANEKRGLRLPTYRSHGNRPMCRAQIYRLFHDRFYTGMMEMRGIMYQGNHPPMITLAEFEQAQRILRGRQTFQEPTAELYFPYRGLIKCGACAGRITARVLTNRHGTTYRHYYCWKTNHKHLYCGQAVVQEKEIEEQFAAFLDEIALPRKWLDAIDARIGRLQEKVTDAATASADRLRGLSRKIDTRLNRLRDLLVEEVITSDDYAHDRERLLLKKACVEEELQEGGAAGNHFVPLRDAFSLLSQAKDLYTVATPQEKRQLAQLLASDLLLKDKKLLITAKEPYATCQTWRSSPNVRGFWDALRTRLFPSGRPTPSSCA